LADEQDWPFDQPPDAAAITVRAVLDGAPILLVSHDADDDGWQFLDGNEVDQDRAVLISMARAVDLDPSVLEVCDLRPGWMAWRRAPGEPWQRGLWQARTETAAD